MTFQEFAHSLFESPYVPQDFKDRLLSISDVDAQSFWNSLLSFLNNQISEEKSTLLESDFLLSTPGDESFFERFSSSEWLDGGCDIDYQIITKNVSTGEYEKNLNGYWNESIQRMVDYFYNNFYSPEITSNFVPSSSVNGHMPNSFGTEFNTHDIKKADAGNLFGEISLDALSILVVPWYNIECYELNNSYYSARTNGDSIDQKAARTEEQLTFTREQLLDENYNPLERYIRLIMPNNSRRVSIEDLNRNFWVISSVLQAITTYLFDNGAPIPKLLKDTLNELVQLWDNIMYLWAAFGLISQNEASDMRVIVMPLPVNNLQHYMKYDGFEEEYTSTTFNKDNFDNMLKPRLQYLSKTYPHSNLCILFYTRYKNYYKNYFQAQTFRGVVFYNAKKEAFSYVPFKAVTEDNPSASIYFNPHDYQDLIFAARETDTYYKWSFPFTHVAAVHEGVDQHRYFGALRVIPEVNFEIGSNGDLQISSLKFTGIDAIEEALYGEGKALVTYELQSPITEESEQGIFSMEQNTDEPALGDLDIYEATVSQAYYLGEIPSCSIVTSNNKVFEFLKNVNIQGNGKLIKIGNYLPEGFDEYYQNTEYYGEQRTPRNTGTTDYLLNMTITGSSHPNNIATIYGILGTGYNQNKSADKCKLYIPVVSKNKIELTIGPKPSEMDIDSYKALGYSVISQYIVERDPSKNITYYIAGVGIKPWHNTTWHIGRENDVFQGYWTTNMLTHLFRYVPNDFVSYFPTPVPEVNCKAIVNKNGKTIGFLYCVGILNKCEQSFAIAGTTTFELDGGTPWRLPQLNPRLDLANYFTFLEQTSETKYFIDPNQNGSPFYQKTGPQIQNMLNTYYQQHSDGHDYDAYLLDGSSIQLTEASGRWCVFDGNSSAGSGSNVENYRKDNTRREVAYLDLVFNENGIADGGFEKGRYKNGDWLDTNLATVLPDGASNMVYDW